MVTNDSNQSSGAPKNEVFVLILFQQMLGPTKIADTSLGSHSEKKITGIEAFYVLVSMMMTSW